MVYQESIIEFDGLYITFVLLTLVIFLGCRKIDLGLFFISNINLWVLTLVFSFFSCLSAALIGFKLKYLSYRTEKIGLKDLLNLIIFMFFHVAILEEIFFRGLIYNYLRQFIGGDLIPFLLTTLLFGYAHISNGGKEMFVLSSIVGFFYGLTYVLTNNLLAAAIVHTITNVIWRLFFVVRSNSASAT
jgi:membrane protease YdiL (CAAX protease family)